MATTETIEAGEKIEVTNIGPIEHVPIPIPAGGGVVVLRGANGAGKTVAIEAVESLVSGKGNVPRRDGTKRGSVEWGDAIMSVSSRNTRKGELEVSSLAGRMDIAEFVDPRMKDPVAGDSRRIKALVNLMGIEPRLDLFDDHLANGENRIFSPDSEACDKAMAEQDLVGLVATIKREIEVEARAAEKQSDRAVGQHKAAMDSIGDINLAAPSDSDELQAELESAIQAESKILERASSAAGQLKAAAEAREKLEAIDVDHTGPTVAEAETFLEESARAFHDQKQIVDNIKGQLAEAEQQLDKSNLEFEHRTALLSAAKKHEATTASWRQSIEESQGVAMPPHADLDAAAGRVQGAREALENGAMVRKAKEQSEAAKVYKQEARDAGKKAEQLRDAAKSCESVLSDAVSEASDLLWVDDGRLMLKTDRGETYFDELSHGERWKVALDIAIERVGSGGIIPVVQEAWEGLQPLNRKRIAEQVKRYGVTILTAECDDGALRAEAI